MGIKDKFRETWPLHIYWRRNRAQQRFLKVSERDAREPRHFGYEE